MSEGEDSGQDDLAGVEHGGQSLAQGNVQVQRYVGRFEHALQLEGFDVFAWVKRGVPTLLLGLIGSRMWRAIRYWSESWSLLISYW